MVVAVMIILGLSFGSFIGAFHWRLHEGKDFVSDRSICEHCKHVLAWNDLIPLISWLTLGGKCRYCKKPIGWLAPALEVFTASLFLISYVFWPYELSSTGDITAFVLWLVTLVGLITLFVYDIRWMLLPNKIIFPLMAIGLAMVGVQSLQSGDSLADVASYVLLGLLVGGGVFYLLFQVSAGRWIGGGDVKLGFLIGIILGPLGALYALIIGFYSAAIIILPLLVLKVVNRKSKIPFGPFLIAGLFVAQIFGENIHEYYLMYFGL